MTSDFKLTKSAFLVNYDISTPVAPFKSDFIVQLHNTVQLNFVFTKGTWFWEITLFI